MLLEMLLSLAKHTNGSMNVVLYFGGGVIHGSLIDAATWLQSWTASIQVRLPDAGLGNMLQDVLEEGTSGDTSRIGSGFVHLQGATYRNGALTVDVPLWRGAIGRLNGWSLEGKFRSRAEGLSRAKGEDGRAQSRPQP